MEHPVRLRRSILSVPANREKMVRKAVALPADVIMLDIEDSVPISEKEHARGQVVAALTQQEWLGKTRSYRINGMNTPFAYRDIIDVVEAAGDCIDSIVVPKVCDPAEVKAVDYLLNQIEMRMDIKKPIALEACVESAEGMLRVEEIAFSSPRLEALVFGVADYGASLGMKNRGISGHGDSEEFYPGHRWHYPQSRLAMAAKAAGLAVIDSSYGDYKDTEGLKKSCLLSASLGFDGKWAIHPDQLPVINEVYTPDPEDIERAKLIIEAYREAQKEGRGSLAIEGKMVDTASVRIARNIYAKWEAINRMG
ncbi:MAG: HpcH/HpaI aldolase/citrate lyase family protein [Syntrophobacteraceae bacterium]